MFATPPRTVVSFDVGPVSIPAPQRPQRPQQQPPRPQPRRQRPLTATAALRLGSGLWHEPDTVPRFSYARSFALAINAAMLGLYVACVAQGGLAGTDENPTLGAPSCELLALGAMYAPLIVRGLQVWRLLSALFVPSGLFTLCVYVATSTLIMFPLELALGSPLVALVFLVCGVMSNMFSCSASTDITTGAGGALMGVVGFRFACIVLLWPEMSTEERRRAGVAEVAAGVLIFFTGLAPQVDNTAHFAGLITGAFMGAALLAPRLDATPSARVVVRLVATGAMVFIFAVWTSLMAAGDLSLIDSVVLSSVVCQATPQGPYAALGV